MRELALVATGAELLSVGFVELLADETAQAGIHPILRVQGHRPFDPVILLAPAQLGEQLLEKAPAQRGLRLFPSRLLELPLDIRLEDVRKLPVIADENDSPLRERHGDQKIERIRPRRLVHDHGAEHGVVPQPGIRHRRADRLLAGRREHHRVVPDGLPDPGGVVLQPGEPLAHRDVRAGCGLLRPLRQRVDHAHDHALHISVGARGDCAVTSRLQPVDQSIPCRPEPSQQILFGRCIGVNGGRLLEA